MSKKTVFILGVIFVIVSFFMVNYLVALIQEVGQYLTFTINSPEHAKFQMVSWEETLKFKKELSEIYIFFYIICFALGSKMYYDYKLNFDNLDKGQHGTRRFATVDEIKKEYQIIPAKDHEYKGEGGVIIAGLQEQMKPYRLLIDNSPVHTLVIGITRSGKGETFVVPMLDVLSRAEKKPSIVVNDPKGELAGASYETLKKRGYEVHIFNLIDQSMGMGFNPLQLVIDAWKNGNYSLAEQYTNSITHSLYSMDSSDKGNAFFDESAASMVSAVILGIVEDAIDRGEEYKVNMYSVVNFIVTMGEVVNAQTGETAMDRYFNSRASTNPARMMYGQVGASTGNTLSSIVSVAISKLQIFISEPNARLTSYNSLDLTDVGFGDKPVAIFMVTPDYDESNHVLASIFTSQLYRVNAEKATMESGKMKRHVHFMLDEFGNMPTVVGMESMVTVGAGRGFRFHLIIQAYSQIQAKYGKEGSDTIVGNCSNQIYILTNDQATADHYSSLLGNKTITDVSRSGQLFSFDKTHSESTKERSLLMSDELMGLKLGESVVVRVNKREDLKRKKIQNNPIYNELGTTDHKFRWQYLADQFDTSTSVLTLPVASQDYYNIELAEIVFTAKPKVKDQYLNLNKLMTGSQFNQLKAHLRHFTSKPLGYDELEQWSPLHLFSHIVYELRPEKSYLEKYLTPRFFNPDQFVAPEVVEYWMNQLDFVLAERGVKLEAPTPQKRTPFGK